MNIKIQAGNEPIDLNTIQQAVKPVFHYAQTYNAKVGRTKTISHEMEGRQSHDNSVLEGMKNCFYQDYTNRDKRKQANPY